MSYPNLWSTPASEDLSVRCRHDPPDYLPGLLIAGRCRVSRSQMAMAREIGISRSYLSRLERGLRCPSITVAEALARTLYLTDSEKHAVIAAGIDGVGRDWYPNEHMGNRT